MSSYFPCLIKEGYKNFSLWTLSRRGDCQKRVREESTISPLGIQDSRNRRSMLCWNRGERVGVTIKEVQGI